MGLSRRSRGMGFVQAAMVAVALVSSAGSRADAACMTSRCSDATVLATARQFVSEHCDCALSVSHKRYMRCVKEWVKRAVSTGVAPAACKKAVLKCESASTCGQGEAVACCTMSKGKMKARVVSSAAKCKGRACPGVRSALDACTDEGECSGVAATFRSVQKVFTGSCALPTCHSAFAREGGLVLDSEEVSYNNLVGKAAVHEQARGLGLLRVKPGDVENSFLIRKLHGLGPGDPMPQGTPPLPDSIISMIEDWVARGARTTAEECPANGTGGTCDTTPIETGNYVWHPEEALPVPAPSEGLQLYVPQRPVDAGTEWETCYAYEVDWPNIAAEVGTGGGAPVIRQQEYRMHSGSHHLLLYQYYGAHPEVYPKNKFFPCFAANCLNPGDCPEDSEQIIPIGGTQVAGTRYVVQYPQGVGLPVLSSKAVLIANLHYTNPFQPPQPIYGEAWLNIYFAKKGEFQALLDGIFAVNYQDMFVEPFQTKTFSRIWSARGLVTRDPVDAAVFQLFGHMHKRGELFQIDFVKGGKCSVSGAICGRDDDCSCKPYQHTCTAGQTCVRAPDAEDTTIYHTTEWDHAPVMDFPKPYLLVNKDQGLRWTCTHTNGDPNDPTRPPKRCSESCNSCGWVPETRTCHFTRGVELGYDTAPRDYNEGDPMPVVFGELADDDMCNMFGYFITQAAAARLP